MAPGRIAEQLVTVDDLGPVDEFHVGGRQGTEDFLAYQLGSRRQITSSTLVPGSGAGRGISPMLAAAASPASTSLRNTSEPRRRSPARVGLSERVSLSAGQRPGELPFADRSFDGAYMLHVGMNIEDKGKLFAEVARVLKPAADLPESTTSCGLEKVNWRFPCPGPQARRPASCKAPPTIGGCLRGLVSRLSTSGAWRDFAIAFFNDLRARAAANGGPPPLGLQISHGPNGGPEGREHDRQHRRWPDRPDGARRAGELSPAQFLAFRRAAAEPNIPGMYSCPIPAAARSRSSSGASATRSA